LARVASSANGPASETRHKTCREHTQQSTGQDARKRTNDGQGSSYCVDT
jgi:hypothetical protein